MKVLDENIIETLRNELYYKTQEGKIACYYSVDLDKDPSVDPKSINEKIAKVQAFKNRVIVILNKALINEQNAKQNVSRLDTCLDSFRTQALNEMQTEKTSADIRKSKAEATAYKMLEESLGLSNFLDEYNKAKETHTKALTFYLEVKNIYDNLCDTSMNLAIQLKSIMLNLKIYGPEEAEKFSIV